MRVKLIKAYDDAFGAAYRVYTKVKRDKPEYCPWELVFCTSFKVLKMYERNRKNGVWSVWSASERGDAYLKEKFGSDEHLYFKNDVELRKFLMGIIPDFIGKDYSGGQEKEFEYV